MAIRIPKKDQAILREWLKKSDPDLNALVVTLESVAPALRPDQLIGALAEGSNLSESKLGNLITAFLNLARTLASHDDDRLEVAQAVFGVLAEEQEAWPSFDEFMAAVDRVTGCNAIRVTAKASEILTDNSTVYCRARTLSEIRPVFSDVGVTPEAFVILHQLKLVYHKDSFGDRGELYVAMDLADLKSLSRVVERAIEKHEALSKRASLLDAPVLTDRGEVQ